MNLKFKEIIIAIITAVIGVLFWWLLKLYFFNGAISFLILAGGAVLFLASVAIFSLLVSSSKIISIFPTILLIGFLVFFELNKISGIALVIFSLLFVIGVNSAKFYQKQLLEIKVWHLSKKVLPKIFLGVSVLVAVVFYLSPESVIFKNNQVKIPESFYNSTIKLSEPIIKNFMPGFSFDMAVQEFYALTAFGNAAKNESIAKDKGISEKDISYISESFGVELLPDEKVKDAFYKIISGKISEFFKSKPERKEIFKDLLALGLFLSLVGLRFLFVFISSVFAAVIFAILKKFGFVKIEIGKADKEFIKL